MNVITHLVRSKNLMVVAVIHQPSSRVFSDLDDLLVLSAGKVAYMGPASEALEYFSRTIFQISEIFLFAENTAFNVQSSTTQQIIFWRLRILILETQSGLWIS